LLASAALGRIERASIPQRVGVAATFTPRAELRPVYARGYAAFHDLYRRNRTFFARYGGA
jgi:hypothetical protein